MPLHRSLGALLFYSSGARWGSWTHYVAFAEPSLTVWVTVRIFSLYFLVRSHWHFRQTLLRTILLYLDDQYHAIFLLQLCFSQTDFNGTSCLPLLSFISIRRKWAGLIHFLLKHTWSIVIPDGIFLLLWNSHANLCAYCNFLLTIIWQYPELSTQPLYSQQSPFNV